MGVEGKLAGFRESAGNWHMYALCHTIWQEVIFVGNLLAGYMDNLPYHKSFKNLILSTIWLLLLSPGHQRR